MRIRVLWTLCFLLAAAASGSAETFSYTGTLSSPEGVFTGSFTLASAGTVTIQTWSFGGGTNGAGTVIAAGGFDPLIALFSGPPATASILVDGGGNPLADADNLYNPPWSYVGNCPPAGMVAIGASSVCGDDLLQVGLAPGTYTLVLTDANYVPAAVYDDGTLSEGFADFTGGVFQTCVSATACITPNGSYAVDVSYPVSTSMNVTPEPSALCLWCTGLAALAGVKRFNPRRRSPRIQGELP